MAEHVNLGLFLRKLHQSYHHPEYLSSDPLEFVHRYSDPWDKEAVALLSALLAYGRVGQIRHAISDALGRVCELGQSPSGFVRSFRKKRTSARWRRVFQGWIHRFNRGGDLELLFYLLGESWERHGSLGAQFVASLEPESPHFGPALDTLISNWKQRASHFQSSEPTGNFRYFLTAPMDGSCCKRWCMFLRWMGRLDALDPGLWTEKGALRGTFPEGRFLSSAQLVIPLDTHVGRISGYLGLSSRRTLDWKAALQITEALRKCAPESASDPVKYDFALSRLGILEGCSRTYRADVCENCALLPACRFANQGVNEVYKNHDRRNQPQLQLQA